MEVQRAKQEILAIREKHARRMREDASNSSPSAKLPTWPEETRGVPNGILRSALFGAIGRGKKRYMKDEPIHAQNGISISYTGISLDQNDLDIWETVLHVARLEPLGHECRITAYQLLKILGKKDTGGNRGVLNNRLKGMKASCLTIKLNDFSYFGSLIDEVYRNEKKHEYLIRLNPKLITLFSSNEFTQIDWKIRHSLNNKPLAQWLHGYYSSHAKPYPIKIATLHKMCGVNYAQLHDFKPKLIKALDALDEAYKTNHQIFSYEIKDNIVYVDKQAMIPS
jgi:hypothetical protein